MPVLQVIDDFLLQYNVGQALLFVFVLLVVGAGVVFRSRRVLALQVVGFGLLFLITPQSLLESQFWKFLGLGLLVTGPMIYVTAPR